MKMYNNSYNPIIYDNSNTLKKKSKIITNAILLKRSLIYQVKEFFENSTLHGVRYIAENGRPTAEKLMWFFFTATGTIAALIIIMSLWEKFQTNPTITGLDTDFHNQQVLFPTAILCSENPYDKEKISDITLNTYARNNKDEVQTIESFLQILTMLSFENVHEAYEMSLNITSPELQSAVLRDLVFKVHASCEDTLRFCKYRDEEINCCAHFYPVYSEHGFCFAFNSRFKSEKNTDIMDKNLVIHDLYETDKKWALYFVPADIARIFIFSQEEYFGWDFRPLLTWDTNQATEILISKKSTYTTDDARQLSISQRKCIFSDEVKLTYHKEEYTFSACMKECRMKKAIKLCKCLPPFYTPVPNVPYCKTEQLLCLANNKNNITAIKDCLHCELSCLKTVYNVEKLNKIFDKVDQYSVNVEFLTWPIIRYKREVLFGWVDLLVSFGGIAGLFLGFSLLSGVEIIYYFTMRACCMVYRNREELYEIEEKIRKKPPPRIDMSLRLSMKRLNAPFSASSTNLRRRSSSLPLSSSNSGSKSYGTEWAVPPPSMGKNNNKRRTQGRIFKPVFTKKIKVTPVRTTYGFNGYKNQISSEPQNYYFLP